MEFLLKVTKQKITVIVSLKGNMKLRDCFEFSHRENRWVAK